MTKIQHRDARATELVQRTTKIDLKRDDEGDDSNVYTFPISSEEPYRRWRGDEILVHEKDAIDLDFLNSGSAPLLYQHNQWSGQIGVVEKAWLDETERRCYATVRFSKRDEAQAVRLDVEDEIMRNVSIGYNDLAIEYTEDEDGSVKEYRVTSWKPLEVSIVSIPADATVGIGRANQKEDFMSKTTKAVDTDGTENRTGGGLPSAAPVPTPTPVQSAEDRADTMDEIYALARSHNRNDLAEDFISTAIRADEPLKLSAFRGVLRGELSDNTPLVNRDIGLSNKETREFSLIKLLRTMTSDATDVERNRASFELEACVAAADNAENETRGHRLPEELMRSWGQFDRQGVSSDVMRAAVSAGGNANVTTTTHLEGSFIDSLRNASSIMQAGVTLLPGLSGDVEIPGSDTDSAVAWLGAEDDDAPETVPSFRRVDLSVKDAAGYTDITRRMLQQTTIPMEAYVRRKLVEGMALGLDKAGLDGSGAAGVPRGVKNTTGIGSVTFAALGAPTRAEVISLWTSVAQANAAIGQRNFIFNALMAEHFMNLRVDPGSGRFMMDGPESPLLATPKILSNQVADNDLFYGNFSDLLMGLWGGLDLDRSTEAKFLSGGVRLRAIQSVDFGVARVGSFALGNGGA